MIYGDDSVKTRLLSEKQVEVKALVKNWEDNQTGNNKDEDSWRF